MAKFKISKKCWIVVGVVLLAIIILLMIRFWTPEDTWLCQNGQWQKHGNPSNQPSGTCPIE